MGNQRRLTGNAARAKIYGAAWTKVAAPACARTDAAVGLVAAAGVDAQVVVNDFDTAEIYRDIREVADAYGNVFVRIPRFWIEKTDGANLKTWRVSKTPFGSSYLPKCFLGPGGVALPYVDIGKYNASLAGDGKLESKSGTYPLINKNIVEYRGYAQANGDGYQQFDIHAVDVLHTLFTVEFATLNSQAIMAGWTGGAWDAAHVATATEAGANRVVVANATAAAFVVGQAIGCGTSQGGNQVFYGRTITSISVVDASNQALNFDGAAANIAAGNIVYSVGWKAGFSAALGSKSGSPVSTSDAKHPACYRGIENPWGSVWQFVDGVNINERQAWVCPDPASYASNLFASPYEQLSYVNLASDGYPTALGFDPDRPFAEFPTAGGGGSTTYYSDYYYQTTGQRIAILGGFWNYGSSAGLRYWDLDTSSALAYVYVAGRLLKKAL